MEEAVGGAGVVLAEGEAAGGGAGDDGRTGLGEAEHAASAREDRARRRGRDLPGL